MARWNAAPSHEARCLHVVAAAAVSALILTGCATTTSSPAPSSGSPAGSIAPSTGTGATTIPPLADIPLYKADLTRSGVHPGPGPLKPPVPVWEAELGCSTGSRTGAIATSLLLIGCDASRLTALDASTGSVAWTADLDSSVQNAPTIADGAVYVATAGGSVISLDLLTGTERWSVAVASLIEPVLADGILYVGTEDGRILGLDPATGETTWTWTEPAGTAVGRFTVVGDTAFVGVEDGTLRAVALADGQERWRFRVRSGGVSTTAITDDTVYVGSRQCCQEPQGELYALDRGTGVERWRVRTEDGNQVAPPTTIDGIVYVPSSDEGLLAISGADGAILWRAETGPMGGQAPAISGDAVYLAMDRSVGAFSRSDGTKLWEVDIDGDVDGSALVSGGMVFVADNSGVVQALAEPDLAALIREATADPRPSVSPSAPPPAGDLPLELVATFDPKTSGLGLPYGMDVGPDGLLYVANTFYSEIAVLDPTHGSIVRRWGSKGDAPGQFDFQREAADIYSSIGGVAIADDGTVYVADTANRRIQSFEADGTHLGMWGSFGTRDGQFIEPIDVAIAPNGDVYVVDDQRDDIQRFTRDGAYLGTIGEHGSGPGQMSFTGSITVGPDGTLYNADWDNDRIQAWSDGGTLLWTHGETGRGPGQFTKPTDLALDDHGRLHVMDLYRIQTFGPALDLLGAGPGETVEISNLAYGDGHLYLSMVGYDQILRFKVLD